MKTLLYLIRFRRQLEAGEQVVLLTNSGPVKIIISCIKGNTIIWHDDHTYQHEAKRSDILPDHWIGWYKNVLPRFK